MTISEHGMTVRRQAITRIPTPNGEFQLALFAGGGDGKEHMALILGDVSGGEDVLTRVHSECFTGDVLGSLRCDCGEQLEQAMQMISAAGSGVILYLRQEGRGIGLLEKIRAYNLQDLGHDTVEANLLLGHEADERDYTIAAQMLNDLEVRSVQLLTNNPLKLAALRDLGVSVTRRIPIEIAPGPDNLAYLWTKKSRMRHLLGLNGAERQTQYVNGTSNGHQQGHSLNGAGFPVGFHEPAPESSVRTRPMVTVSYAQSLDGSIASADGTPLIISGEQSMTLTHRLRASHDAILIGIGTALTDDPRLTVRLVSGSNPQPVIVDSHLRFPPDASVFTEGHGSPWIVTTPDHDPERSKALTDAGATILTVPAQSNGQVDLAAMLDLLGSRGIRSLMVEGGSRIIQSMLSTRLADYLVITVSPCLIGGLRVLPDGKTLRAGYPGIEHVHYQRLGDDIVLWGRPVWEPE